jgi:hypothetical protein
MQRDRYFGQAVLNSSHHETRRDALYRVRTQSGVEQEESWRFRLTISLDVISVCSLLPVYTAGGIMGLCYADIAHKPDMVLDVKPDSRRNRSIEHVNSSVKRCRMLKDTIRLTKDGLCDMVIEIGCGLHNLRVRLDPWCPCINRDNVSVVP